MVILAWNVEETFSTWNVINLTNNRFYNYLRKPQERVGKDRVLALCPCLRDVIVLQ